MKSTSKLTAKGQTTIPSEIRESLGLYEGDILIYEIDRDKTLRVRKLEDIDLDWAHAVEATLSEWRGSEDDDL
ncbi:MAG: AbrB/MazE/SpoVT family DNA-binding domain-containing protein [Bradymonadales bacterium]|nr:MAG: AbrB/MazE/SpoVT family DNA-binding domain-containing protein [Bradymonadales bacterium]